MRRAVRENRPWAWIDSRMLNIPRYDVNVAGQRWNPSDTGPDDFLSTYEDLYRLWSSMVTYPVRPIATSPGCLKYRLAIFIHKHAPRRASGTINKIDTIYSVSIWDRERNELRWHDPWPDENRARRQADIVHYWRDCPTNWRDNGLSNVNFSNILQVSNNYAALRRLHGCSFRAMEPRFSYWSIVGIVLWCMNNINDPNIALTPPDTEGVLSAMDFWLLPSLFECLFTTLFENGLGELWPGPDAPPDSIIAHSNFLRSRYNIEYDEKLKSDLDMILARYRVANGGPLPNWVVTAVTDQ